MARDAAYDIVLDDRGYMLAREDQIGTGPRRWQVETVGASIASQSPKEGQYGNQAPIIELPMVWHTGHLGYGDAKQQQEGRYHYSVDMDARFPEQIIPGPKVHTLATTATAPINRILEYRGQLYALGGRYLFSVQRDNTLVTEKDLGAGKVATDAAIFNQKMYVGMGFAEPFWEWDLSNWGIWNQSLWNGGDIWRSTGEAWAQATGSYYNKIAIFKDRMWANVSRFQVKSVSADPKVAGNWTGAYRVGDPGLDITSLIEFGNTLYIGKADALYALGSDGRAICVTPEMRSPISIDNCVNATAWHGLLWVPHQRGLWAIQRIGEEGFTVLSVTPGANAVAENPVRGTVTAMVGDNRWLYVTVRNGQDSYLLAGREPMQSEMASEQMIWHPLAKLEGVRCGAMCISGGWENPRLWLGLGTKLGYIVLPRHGDNPLMDANCQYNTNGSITFPAHSWQAPVTRKVFKGVEVLAEGLSSQRYLDCYYRANRQSWLYAGRVNLPPRNSLRFAENGIPANQLEIRLTYSAQAADTPVVIRDVVVRGAERPTACELITCVIRCADNLPLNTGAVSNRKAADILTQLKYLSTKDRAVKLKDTTGAERYVLVLPGIEEIESEQEGTQERELLLVVRMAEFHMAHTEGTSAYGIWNESTWNGGDLWG
jgi:hypothetical protein